MGKFSEKENCAPQRQWGTLKSGKKNDQDIVGGVTFE